MAKESKDQLSIAQKAIIFTGQFLLCAIIYGVVLYLLELIFGAEQRHSFKMIAIQSVLFGFAIALWTTWSASRKKKKADRGNN